MVQGNVAIAIIITALCLVFGAVGFAVYICVHQAERRRRLVNDEMEPED